MKYKVYFNCGPAQSVSWADDLGLGNMFPEIAHPEYKDNISKLFKHLELTKIIMITKEGGTIIISQEK